MGDPSMKPGTEVIVWGRCAQDVILLFGEGTYEGDDFVNGAMVPVVKLSNGSDLVVYFQGVAVGRKDAVARTCKAFNGVVMQWDINAFNKGRLPSKEEIERLRGGAPATAPNGGPPVLPEPKTMTDRLMNLKREIEYQESKKKVLQSSIEEADKLIIAKRAEMLSIKEAVLKELDGFDVSVTHDASKAGAVITAHVPGEVLGMPLNIPVTMTEALPAEPPPVAPAQQDTFDADAKRLSLED